MELNAGALKVRMSAAAPGIARGLVSAYKGLSAPALARLLVNFPPCMLPGFRHLMADWEVEAEQQDETLMLPDGRQVRMHSMKDAQRSRLPSCSGCLLSKRCRGVDRRYLKIFGPEEFSPLRREPAPAAIKSLL